MQAEIVKVYSGNCATFYSVRIRDGSSATLFDEFITDNMFQFPAELRKINDTIRLMSDEIGAREYFFKMNEGRPGDGVCALYDNPDKHLRLYCIRYGRVAVILGSGGEKSKSIRAFQEDPKLKRENELLRKLSLAISQALKEGIMYWSEDGLELLGEEEPLIIEL